MGHIFQLGRKYADALGLQVLDENGKLVTVTMGSYGIGVSRAVAAIAEDTHDELGLCWPREVAPADVHLVATGKDEAVFDGRRAARRRADRRRASTVLYDDRPKVSPGVKFKDAELIGVPDDRRGRPRPGRRRRRGQGPRRTGEREDVAGRPTPSTTSCARCVSPSAAGGGGLSRCRTSRRSSSTGAAR